MSIAPGLWMSIKTETIMTKDATELIAIITANFQLAMLEFRVCCSDTVIGP